MRPTRRWRVRSECYRWFARHWSGLDFSDAAAAAMFEYESRGGNSPGWSNGFMVGKHWLDWWVAESMSMIREGTMALREIMADQELPEQARTMVWNAMLVR